MKYKHKDVKECFYTLAWSTLTKEGVKTNILASGGVKGEIRMYHPRKKVCYYCWRPVDKKDVSVNSLVFHSSEPSWIFCATNDGVVTMWDVETPNLPDYNGCGHKLLMEISPNYGDIYNIVWSGHDSNWLLAGSAAGLLGWNVETDKVKKQRSKYQPIESFLDSKAKSFPWFTTKTDTVDKRDFETIKDYLESGGYFKDIPMPLRLLKKIKCTETLKQFTKELEK